MTTEVQTRKKPPVTKHFSDVKQGESFHWEGNNYLRVDGMTAVKLDGHNAFKVLIFNDQHVVDIATFTNITIEYA